MVEGSGLALETASPECTHLDKSRTSPLHALDEEAVPQQSTRPLVVAVLMSRAHPDHRYGQKNRPEDSGKMQKAEASAQRLPDIDVDEQNHLVVQARDAPVVIVQLLGDLGSGGLEHALLARLARVGVVLLGQVHEGGGPEGGAVGRDKAWGVVCVLVRTAPVPSRVSLPLAIPLPIPLPLPSPLPSPLPLLVSLLLRVFGCASHQKRGIRSAEGETGTRGRKKGAGSSDTGALPPRRGEEEPHALDLADIACCDILDVC